MKQNVGFFMFSLVFALVLWLVVERTFEPQSKHQLTVKLEMQGLPHDFVAVLPPTVIEVTAIGAASEFRKLRDEDIRATVDLSDVKDKGDKDARVKVTWPPDIGITLTANQRVVRISIDTEDELKDREVDVFPTGETPKGVQFVLANCRVFPQKVKVRGPSGLLPQVHFVRAKLDLAMLSTGENVTAPVEVQGANGEVIQGLRSEPATVTVDPRAVAAPATKIVLVNPTYDGQLPPGYELANVRVMPNQVELRGPAPGSLDGIVRVLTEPIKLEGITAQGRQRVKLKLPTGVTSEPEDVEVILDVTPPPKGARS